MSELAAILADRQALYFIYQDGCPACAESEPELTAFERAHPGLLVLRLTADGPFGQKFGKIEATPTWFFQRGDQAIARVGYMKAKQIETWIKKAGGKL